MMGGEKQQQPHIRRNDGRKKGGEKEEDILYCKNEGRSFSFRGGDHTLDGVFKVAFTLCDKNTSNTLPYHKEIDLNTGV